MRFQAEEVLGAMPPLTIPLVESLIAAAESHGVTLHLVGGPVRDLLLERPIRDVDVVMEPVERFGAAELAHAAAPPGAEVREHDRFGTVRLSTTEASVDLATARRERYRHPGALPQVEPASLKEDLLRRDFSVNALALPLRSGGRVEVVDPVAGRADLEGRVLRVLHDRSFHDDPTRALRAARLGARLDFHLTRGSRSALRDALRDGAFGGVSGDRLRRELEKLFDDAYRDLDPAQALRLLADWHVLSSVEPGLVLPKECVAPIRRLGRAISSSPWRVTRFRPWAAGLSVWLAPLAPSLRRRVLARLSVRGELSRRISEFPSATLGLLEPLASARGRGAVDSLLSGIDEEQLHALHAWAPTAVRRRIVRWAAEDRARRSPVTGNDLTGIGIEGADVGLALARIRVAFLDGAVANREEGLALAREISNQSAPGRRTPRKRPAKKPPRKPRRKPQKRGKQGKGS